MQARRAVTATACAGGNVVPEGALRPETAREPQCAIVAHPECRSALEQALHDALPSMEWTAVERLARATPAMSRAPKARGGAWQPAVGRGAEELGPPSVAAAEGRERTDQPLAAKAHGAGAGALLWLDRGCPASDDAGGGPIAINKVQKL